MHTPEDEAHNYLLARRNRSRDFALALSLTFPALYVAVAMYHQEMIPAKLLLSVIQAKQQVPFSVPAIILFMLIAFELLQEAGLRLPNSIGQTVSIIGALLVGQSAVDAKIVSPVAIIVVALAGIAGYRTPKIGVGQRRASAAAGTGAGGGACRTVRHSGNAGARDLVPHATVTAAARTFPLLWTASARRFVAPG